MVVVAGLTSSFSAHPSSPSDDQVEMNHSVSQDSTNQRRRVFGLCFLLLLLRACPSIVVNLHFIFPSFPIIERQRTTMNDFGRSIERSIFVSVYLAVVYL